jgi:lysophospholipase L1-like esterase
LRPGCLYFERIIVHYALVKDLRRFAHGIWWLWSLALPAQAAFSNLYVFGDGVCTTTNGPGGTLYYGKRYSNGRVWVEVLAQWQALSYDSNKNWSYFGHYSPDLLTNLSRFTPPPDANSALFVVWVDDADFVWNVEHYGTDLAQWTNAINKSLSNHYTAITNLYYAKGARALVMPNAVDIARTPYYSGLPSANKNFIRQRTIDFNNAFLLTLSQARSALPGITIYSPDAFSLFDQMLAQPANYGLTNAGIDALEDPALTDKSLNGPGANYVFWDYLDPTAKAHVALADLVQQVISPAYITQLSLLGSSNRLVAANVPVGRNGTVLGSDSLLSWTPIGPIQSTSPIQPVFVPAAGLRYFYRLQFPLTWSWP